MRISSLSMNQSPLAKMLRTQERVSQAMEKISSGKRYLLPSDSPIETNRIQLLKNNTQVINAYQTNNALAENQLSGVEDSLQNISDTLRRINDLKTQAANGTLQQSQRKAIATEIKAHLDSLLSIANRQDSDGNYLFSGFRSDIKPYQLNAGSYQYQGDAGVRQLQVGTNTFVPISASGYDLFERVKDGNGIFHTTDGVTTNTGSGIISQGQVLDLSAFNNETYAINFALNASSQLVYSVTGSSSGQLIPALPGAIPADAPLYVDGQSIQFAGIEVDISGTPLAGDDFAVEPSSPQNIFDTLNKLVAALEMPTTTSVETAAFYNALDRQAGAFNGATENLLTELTQVGANLNIVDSERLVNDDLRTHNTKTLSLLEDLDVAEAVSKLTQEMSALEMAQLSYAKIQHLSLFNYL